MTKLGELVAFVLAGMVLAFTVGCTQIPPELKAKAESGDASAQYKIGEMYVKGQAVPHDLGEAIKWYRKAARQGHAGAQFKLGGAYAFGIGVPTHLVEAFMWMRKAAEQGHTQAQTHLGVMYESGHGVPKNLVEAVKWYRKSAEQGYVWGQFNLGVKYNFGKGVPKDLVEAVRWYRKSAEQGHPHAQSQLGVMYKNGEGVPKDILRAHMWYYLAAGFGHGKTKTRAISWRDDLAKNMTPSQIEKAQKLAEEWIQNYKARKRKIRTPREKGRYDQFGENCCVISGGNGVGLHDRVYPGIVRPENQGGKRGC